MRWSVRRSPRRHAETRDAMSASVGSRQSREGARQCSYSQLVTTARIVLRIALVVGIAAFGACSGSEEDATPEPVPSATAAPPVEGTSCWDLVGETVSPDPMVCVTGEVDQQVPHGYKSVVCEDGPELAFIGGDSDPILLYGRVGETWTRFKGPADFPETAGEPYRACRPSEPPCRGDVLSGSPNPCPEG